MARRPVFIPLASGGVMVRTEMVEFDWHPGLSISQKQKSVASLHQGIRDKNLGCAPLEVSSKSLVDTGVALSAFNLGGKTKSGRGFTVETVFQSSKVFENGGPFVDLRYGSSRGAKTDPRLKTSGRLLKFRYFDEEWKLEPKTAFYDWVYINTLARNPDLALELANYDCFTDIEFNPDKSINCQAYSVALFVALRSREVLESALESQADFLRLAGYGSVSNAYEDTSVQPRLV